MESRASDQTTRPTTPLQIIRERPWLVLAAAFLGWLFDGFEMGLFPIVARPAFMDMLKAGDAQVGEWMGYVTALFLLGAAAGGLLFGWLGDKIGRVRAMALSILTYSIFTALSFFAVAPWHLGVFRFVASLGMGGEWSLGVALVMESWPENYRPMLAGVIGAAANVGFLLVGWVGRSFPVTKDHWRWMFLVGAIPAALVFVIILFVPESQRWKASVKTAAGNPLVEIFTRHFGKTVLAIAFSSVALIGTWGSIQWIPLWVDQITKNPALKAESGMFTAFGAIIGCMIGPLLGGKIGRRPAFFGLCLASLVICAVLFRGMSAYNTTFRIVIFLAGCSTAAFYGWFPLYLPELFPTRIRAAGQGISYNFGRIFAAAGAVTQGRLVDFFHGSYARAGAVVTLVYIIGMILIWLAPETKGQPLPE